MTMRRPIATLLTCLLLIGLLPTPVLAAGACSIYRSWNVGDSFTAADATQSFVTVGQTNMIWSCLDDYSANVTQMQSTVDPYPTSVVSLATTGQGELERLRYVIKKLTGWSQWYAHTETPVFTGTAPDGATYITQTTNATLSAEQSLGALTTGLLLNTVTVSTGVLTAYAGTSCTNQFPRSLNASGAATCASVANADLAGSIAASKLVGTDIATVGTITSGTWTGTAIAFAQGGTGLTTALDDTTLVSNGSAWVASALPNCTAATTALQYATASNAFSCGTISAGLSAASQAEMEAATSNTVAATPGTTQYHPGVAKFWGKWNDAGSLLASYNITSITDTAVGDHTVNIGTDFSSGNYAVVATGGTSGNQMSISTMVAGTVRIIGWAGDTPFGLADMTTWFAVGYGDQ